MIFYSPYNQTLMGVSNFPGSKQGPLSPCIGVLTIALETRKHYLHDIRGYLPQEKTQEYSISCCKLIYLLCTFYKSEILF